MVLLSHPTGNQFVRQTALAFAEANLLEEFWTTVSWNSASHYNRLLPGKLFDELNRRAYPREVRPFLRNHPWRELGRLACQLSGIKWLTRHEQGWCSVDGVYRELDQRVADRISCSSQLRAVYAYEDGALDSFQAAAGRGLARIYDLPIGHWRAARALFQEEAQLQPEWAVTLTGSLDSDEKLARKEQELQLASEIIVASSFTRQTLEAVTGLQAPVHVIPYGAPAVGAPRATSRTKGPLKVLYVGSLTQRKGLSYFLQAGETMGRAIEITLLGRKAADGCRPLDQALQKHRWLPSLPHHAVLAEMSRHDVLVFPSLFEGFGLVILEAMAQGLPVITTAHTAGPELIDDGLDGFLIPIRSSSAIAEKLQLLAGQPGLLTDMAHAAQRKAAQLGWENYRAQLVTIVKRALKTPVPMTA